MVVTIVQEVTNTITVVVVEKVPAAHHPKRKRHCGCAKKKPATPKRHKPHPKKETPLKHTPTGTPYVGSPPPTGGLG